MPVSPATAFHALLAGAVDYAGLFPPAALSLAEVLRNYRAYRTSADAWALGRMVIPVARLGELENLLRDTPLTSHPSPPTSHPLPLTAVLGPDLAAEVAAIERFNRAAMGSAQVESVEVKAPPEAELRDVLAAIPHGWGRYVELPLGQECDVAYRSVAAGGAFAKLRTGGTVAEAFPAPDQLLWCLAGLARLRLPFKATAGLHHPLRGSYRLTYASAAPSGVMFGYLNLMLAAAVLWREDNPAKAEAVLLEQDPRAICVEGTAVSWKSTRFEAAALSEMRRDFFHSFGSCSFREPLDELAAWL